MPSCDTRFFGPSDFAEEDTLVFPQGLPGFPGDTRFILMQRPGEHPLSYLQSAVTSDLCFLTLPILAVEPGYRLTLSAEDALLLGTQERPRIGEDVLCLALLSVREAGPTANLLAPVVVNLRTHVGTQCFNVEGEYSVQHPLTLAGEEVAA